MRKVKTLLQKDRWFRKCLKAHCIRITLWNEVVGINQCSLCRAKAKKKDRCENCRTTKDVRFSPKADVDLCGDCEKGLAAKTQEKICTGGYRPTKEPKKKVPPTGGPSARKYSNK